MNLISLFQMLIFPSFVISENVPLLIPSQFFQLVVDQSRWRDWSSAYLIGGETSWKKEVMQELSKEWIQSSSNLENDFLFDKNIGYVCFDKESSPCYVSNSNTPWFILVNNSRKEKLKLELATSSNIRFDSDIILAIYNESSFISNETSNSILLQQVYKVHNLAPLTVIDLGFWRLSEKMPNLSPKDSRRATRQFKIRVGVKNVTGNIESADPQEVTVEANHQLTRLVENEEQKYIFELVLSLTQAINMSYELKTFSKTGWRNEEQEWTHLIGAVADGEVDIGAGTVALSEEDIANVVQLTNPIIFSMSGVYHKIQEGVRVRDVFSTTFNLPLRLGILGIGTIILLWIAMLLVTFTSVQLLPASSVDADERHPLNARLYSPSEAFMWLISVICMQGSPWSPKSASGCLLLFFSLTFALIIFNSFAAFITSILSVHGNSIKSVQDLLKDNEFVYGYTKQSEEERFLRTTDDKQLLSFYYRALLSGGGVPDVGEGMVRAAHQRFAFFASARLARRALRSIVPQRQRCNLNELFVPGTVISEGLPISKSSPYKNSFRYWMLRVRQTGILNRIKLRLLPPMPACVVWQKFTGVRIEDLMIAYYTYMSGLFASCIILIGEIFWAKRKNLFGQKRSPSHHSASEMAMVARQHFHSVPQHFWGDSDFVN